MDDFFARAQIVPGHRFKRSHLWPFTGARIAQTHITVAGFAAKISIVYTRELTRLIVERFVDDRFFLKIEGQPVKLQFGTRMRQ